MEKKKKTSWSEILLYIYLSGVVLFIFLGPTPRRVGGRGYGSKQKACYSNIRIIQGALEMYNMDVDTMMSTLDQRILIEEKYMKSTHELECPETSIGGTYSGENLTEDGEIICSYHGGLIAPGPFDNGTTIKGKKTREQIEKERKIYIDHCITRIPFSFFWPLLSYPDALTTFCK